MATKVQLQRLHKSGKCSEVVNGFIGFSWTVFFFGPIPMLFRGRIAEAIAFVLLAIMATTLTGGIGNFVLWVVAAFCYNKYHLQSLEKEGFELM